MTRCKARGRREEKSKEIKKRQKAASSDRFFFCCLLIKEKGSQGRLGDGGRGGVADFSGTEIKRCCWRVSAAVQVHITYPLGWSLFPQ